MRPTTWSWRWRAARPSTCICSDNRRWRPHADFDAVVELERQIEELKRVASETAVDVTKELPARERLAELRTESTKLTPMQRVSGPHRSDRTRSIT